ncbi:MAG: hypothetical protein ISS57_19320 [Anaerolineales bacterium]|nr:hypothetical protein [Anaerolineales bacterium]
MWTGLSEWLQKISNGWVVFAVLVVFMLFTAFVLPTQAVQADQNNAGVDTPDLSFYYSPEKLYQMAESYGEAGRQEYIKARFTFDLVWPIVYTLSLVTSISWLTRRGFAPDSRWQRANLVPVLAVVFDYIENISTSLVMFRYPARTPVIDFVAPFFTSIKWILVGGSFGLWLIGIGAGIFAWIKKGSAD